MEDICEAFHIDKKLSVPLFKQIIVQIEHFILLDIWKTDTVLPSLRTLASHLNINVNTVQKSYTILKDQNIIYVYHSEKWLISENAKHILQLEYEKRLDELYEIAFELYLMHVDQAEVIFRIRQAYFDVETYKKHLMEKCGSTYLSSTT
ncbi:GntR family transcriptional regulator [Ethanoligenens harbinense]|uniref:Transcriptional regulator, GntR family n=1 Tax=Ethanoligenens harbinense (strain DSM 18485 / JCM 12961 / CGMCC 1.5033 / YUAN-3) TaxID=663278 RepID=E6UA36_ETHHY|nr:GntR family transcriptional regulator [Ethanoligenens harbinense]ADU27397.1 transcriptional regulator, GntR family [Ethanoligenens harbinense YUAN-3]AVQ96456.1 hypothetical protein CXQ68_09600 [Ethanoligenens harbinense YUAN-3]AYF39115.1 hypothetical protein CXP51_09470 [Ethanoligenens harbinense]AYF41941.1 hypothetical protein CN246_10040 [Ethanoligenens harbinense]QCN92697.1 GntR family transcriptional regulator [Ethanoligenens harbinense]